MKKILTFAAAALLAATTAHAFRVVTLAPLENGASFTCPEGGKVTAVEAYSPSAASGTVTLDSIWTAAIFTNAVELLPPTTQIVHTVVWSNDVTAAVFTNSYTSLAVHAPLHLIALSSNTVYNVSQITNSWPVLKETAVATNAIVTGTAEDGKYSGAPASATYIAPGEKLIFTGTASGGFLRIILE